MQNIDYVFDGVGNVMSYTNNCLEKGNYSTTQNYEYDNLYQLTKAGGTTVLNRYKTSLPDYTSCYEQNFAFDNLGNMTSKGSREWMLNGTKPSSDLNYSFEYNYAEGYVHRLKNAGNRYYEYDPNGNLIREYDSNGAGESEMLSKVQLLSSDDSDSTVYGTEGAWGFGIETSPVKTGINNFERTYIWDDKNRLGQTKDAFYTTNYVYNSNDERVAKYTDRSETLYFNNFWSWHTDPANIYSQGQLSKHIYLGDTRIVTKVSQEVDNTIGGEKQRVFYYHTDHLGSASLVTDYRGNEYERLEYTPYGELWVDLGGYTEGTYIPFKFSAKEMDEETGLYYFGARYLDPKYSMWISADPALGEYIPQSGRDKNEQLPGMGGVYTHINFHLYHYAGNNPVRYVDPDGRNAMPNVNEHKCTQQELLEQCLKYNNLLLNENRLLLKIKKLQMLKTELFLARLDNYKDAFAAYGETILSILQITGQNFDPGLNDISIQDLTEYVSDFDSDNLIQNNPRKILLNDLNYLKLKIKIDIEISDLNFQLKKIQKDIKNQKIVLLKAYVSYMEESK